MSQTFDPAICVPLRTSYEVFEAFKKTPMTVTASTTGHGFIIVNDPNTFHGFLPACEKWVDGAATYVNGEWLVFVANYIENGWRSIETCRPIGMHDADVVLWRKNIIDNLDTFFGYKFRTKQT